MVSVAGTLLLQPLALSAGASALASAASLGTTTRAAAVVDFLDVLGLSEHELHLIERECMHTQMDGGEVG